jgi:hypothetical protein
MLPPYFFEEVYVQMHEWLQYKPTIQPPHSRDLLHPLDGNYNVQEEVFETGFPNNEPTLRAYRQRGQDETENLSSNSELRWGHGPWSGVEPLQRPPPQS